VNSEGVDAKVAKRERVEDGGAESGGADEAEDNGAEDELEEVDAVLLFRDVKLLDVFLCFVPVRAG
jgi:hypothetical protein